MNRAYEEAFVEIDEILKIMPIELLSRIPVQFRQVISDNKAKNYKIEIEQPLKEEKLKKETIVILGLIYRDFLASPEEREEMQTKDAEELTIIEDIPVDLILYKEKGFFKKFFNLLKGIFNRNKF